MPETTLRIARPHGYPSRFNTPRHSRHRIDTRKWLPLHKAWQPLEVVLLMPTHGADLITTFNRIPLGRKPFVIAFESHLPRLFGYEHTDWFRRFTDELAADRCRAIVPISRFAQGMFLAQHEGGPHAALLREKSRRVIYPSVEVPAELPERQRRSGPLKVLFAGSHFARKGGVALLMAAERAAARGLAMELHVASDMVVGGENGVWTDPMDASFFDEFRELAQKPNVVMHGKVPNADLLRLMATCDVGALPTLCDTFGYSVLESFAAGIPVIGTRAYALPELIVPNTNGFLVDIETSEAGEWAHLFKMDRSTDRYRRFYRDTMSDLADRLVAVFAELADDPGRLSAMSRAAHASALERFEARQVSRTLDDLYVASLAR